MQKNKMWKKLSMQLSKVVRNRHYSRLAPPRPVEVDQIRKVLSPRGGEGSKPRQLLSLPPFPSSLPLPSKSLSPSSHVTAISWLKFYFADISDKSIQTHFNKSLVHMELPGFGMKKIRPNEVMEPGTRLSVPVSIAESRISKRFDTIPSATLCPNADEIKYLQRLVKYKDSSIIVLNKPPRLPIKGNLPIHNSMDALAAAALSYDYNEGPKLVHRLDKESSGLLLFGRNKESIDHLHWLFSDIKKSRSWCKAWNDACESTYQRYWALVIGCPKEKEGVIQASLSKVLLNDGKTERIILAQNSGLEASQEAITEYRVLGPMVNGCSWIELCPLTSRKHQLRVHCAEALGTPIVGDYKYGWFVHRRWKQMPRVDIEPISGEAFRLRRPDNLDVQKGSVLSKVPLLHLHCRELVLPNIAKFIQIFNEKSERPHLGQDLLRFVASMPTHMKISWNLMSSYLV